MSDKFFILACDGGGILGLSSAVILEEIEKRIQNKIPDKEFRDYFGLITGTSTGSIIACGVSGGVSAQAIRNLYRNQGIDIFLEFPNVLRAWLRTLRLGFTGPIYKSKYKGKDGNLRGIEPTLQRPNALSNTKFGDLKRPTLVTSYDMRNQEFVLFNNLLDSHVDIEAWEIARASSAAPAAFPAYVLTNEKFIQEWTSGGKRQTILDSLGKKGIPLIDGGLVANNPALCAVAERLALNKWVNKTDQLSKKAKKWVDDPAVKLNEEVKQENIVVVSIGTGTAPDKKALQGKPTRQLTYKDAEGWGLLEWISPLRDIPMLRTLFDGSADLTDFQVRNLLSEKNYFRFQPKFSEDYKAFSANPKDLDSMIRDTKNYLGTISSELDRLIDMMTE